MALIMNKDLPTGVSGNYWKISALTKDFILGRVEVVIVLFKDKATREKLASKPMLVVRRQMAVLALAEGSKDDRDAYYLELKKSVLDKKGHETNPFVTATDG